MLTDGDKNDPLYPKALALVLESKEASISMLQRHLSVGYNHAARLIEAMESEGVLAPMDKHGIRKVLLPPNAPAGGQLTEGEVGHESSSTLPTSTRMTDEEQKAYNWAIETQFNSVAARNSRILAKYIERTLKAGARV